MLQALPQQLGQLVATLLEGLFQPASSLEARLLPLLRLLLRFLNGLELFFQHFQVGEAARAGQTHIRDLVLPECSEDGLGELLEIGLSGQLVLVEQVGEGGAKLQAELAVFAGGGGEGAGVGVRDEAQAAGNPLPRLQLELFEEVELCPHNCHVGRKRGNGLSLAVAGPPLSLVLGFCSLLADLSDALQVGGAGGDDATGLREVEAE